MINFRDPDDLLPSVISVSSLIVIAGALCFMLFVHPPTKASLDAAATKQQLSLKMKAKMSANDLVTRQELVDKQTWTGDGEAIFSTALDKVTQFAHQRGIKLMVFRPQRASIVDNLVTLPYLVTVEGSFPGVLAFSRDIDDPKTKLALTQIQLSSSDPNTDKVTGIIGISAYINPTDLLPADTSSAQSRREPRLRFGRPTNHKEKNNA
jgi:hypothetical protein